MLAEAAEPGSSTMRGQWDGLLWRDAMRAFGEEAAQSESLEEMRPLDGAEEALTSLKLEKVRWEYWDRLPEPWDVGISSNYAICQEK